MIGKCPHCGISLSQPPFENRNTNEVLLTLRYRDFIDNNKPIPTVEQKGYCEICNAKLKDVHVKIVNPKSSNLSL